MSADPPKLSQDRWRDVDGVRVVLFCWVEQIAEDPERGTLFSRLHKRGQVVGRGPLDLYVRFHGEGQLISLPPHLVRVLPEAPYSY